MTDKTYSKLLALLHLSQISEENRFMFHRELQRHRVSVGDFLREFQRRI